MNFTNSVNHKSGNVRRRVIRGCKTIAATCLMDMQYSVHDSRDVKNERAIKHFANVGRRMKEILQNW